MSVSKVRIESIREKYRPGSIANQRLDRETCNDIQCLIAVLTRTQDWKESPPDKEWTYIGERND